MAVQIICNLYKNNPTQKILVVAHSNAALNDIFEKIRNRDVDPRHMVRLGAGSEDLFAGLEDFSRTGRVNYSLSRRLQLLQQIQYLARSLEIVGDVGSTCETADYFQLEHIKPRIDQFYQNIKSREVEDVFPFNSFFNSSGAPESVTKCKDLKAAEKCFELIDGLFTELKEFRPFELLRSMGQRGDYILTKQVGSLQIFYALVFPLFFSFVC